MSYPSPPALDPPTQLSLRYGSQEEKEISLLSIRIIDELGISESKSIDSDLDVGDKLGLNKSGDMEDLSGNMAEESNIAEDMDEESSIGKDMMDVETSPAEEALDKSSLSKDLNSTEKSEKDLVIDNVEKESFEEESELDEVASEESPAKKAKLEEADKPSMFKFMFVNECLDEDLDDGLDSAEEDSAEDTGEALTEGDEVIGNDGVGHRLTTSKGNNASSSRKILRRNQMRA